MDSASSDASESVVTIAELTPLQHECVEDVFAAASEGNAAAELVKPGAGGLAVLMSNLQLEVTEANIVDMCQELDVDSDANMSKATFRKLAQKAFNMFSASSGSDATAISTDDLPPVAETAVAAQPAVANSLQWNSDVHIVAFAQQKVFNHHFNAEGFVPMVPVEVFEEVEKRHEANLARQDLLPAKLGLFEEDLWQAWLLFKEFNAWTGLSAEVLAKQFLREKYFSELKSFNQKHSVLAGVATPTFAPKVDPNHDTPSEQTLQSRQDLLLHAVAEDEEACQKKLASMWAKKIAAADEDLRPLMGADREGIFAAKNYYVALQAVVQERQAAKSPCRVDPYFDSPSDDVLAHRLELMASVSAAQHQVCLDRIDVMWQEKVCNIDADMLASLGAEMFEKFVEKHYFDQLGHVLNVGSELSSSSNGPCFVPLVDPAFDNNMEAAVKRRMHMMHLRHGDEEKVMDGVRLLWSTKLQKLSSDVRDGMPAEPVDSFVRLHYFSQIELLADQKSSLQSDVRPGSDAFVPAIDPSTGVSADVASKRAALLKKLKNTDEATVTDKLRQIWEAKLQTLPSDMRDESVSEPPTTFLQKYYYDIVEEVVAAQDDSFLASSSRGRADVPQQQATVRADHAGAMAPNDVQPPGAQDTSQAFFSLDADMFVEDAFETQKLQFICSTMVNSEGKFRGYHWKWHGYVEFRDSKPRIISSKQSSYGQKRNADGSPKKQALQTEDTQALGLLGRDDKGYVLITLWDEAVVKYLHVFPDGEVGSHGVLVSLEYMRVVDLKTSDKFNGVPLTTIRTLQSTAPIENISFDGTIVSRITKSTSPYFTMQPSAFQPWSPQQCVTEFVNLRGKLKPPCRLTVKGTVADVERGDRCRSGEAKCYFSLVDASGAWLSCCAAGRLTKHKKLKNGEAVILFFAFGRPSIGSDDPMLWVFNHSAVFSVGSSDACPRKRMQIAVEDLPKKHAKEFEDRDKD